MRRTVLSIVAVVGCGCGGIGCGVVEENEEKVWEGRDSIYGRYKSKVNVVVSVEV
jgi:hypothetical protein